MKDFKRATQDYANGFLTPNEYLSYIEERLRFIGANQGISDTINKVLKPLADYVCNIIATNNINRETIEGYFVDIKSDKDC